MVSKRYWNRREAEQDRTSQCMLHRLAWTLEIDTGRGGWLCPTQASQEPSGQIYKLVVQGPVCRIEQSTTMCNVWTAVSRWVVEFHCASGSASDCDQHYTDSYPLKWLKVGPIHFLLNILDILVEIYWNESDSFSISWGLVSGGFFQVVNKFCKQVFWIVRGFTPYVRPLLVFLMVGCVIECIADHIFPARLTSSIRDIPL